MTSSQTIAAVIVSASIGLASVPASAQSFTDFFASVPAHQSVSVQSSSQDYIDSLSGKTFRVSQRASVSGPSEQVRDAGRGYIDTFSTPVFHGPVNGVTVSESFSRPQTLISN